ncbi:MAG TPA: Ig-like domain-containing protein [Pirellulaceae bacterium]|nr:Ig-like domain-containing protein [Pirellulaceae bacterium]
MARSRNPTSPTDSSNEAIFEPADIRFTEVSIVSDETTTDDRFFSNQTPGYHKMINGRADIVQDFLNQFSLDIGLVGFVPDEDLIIDPRVLMTAMPGGFAPFEFESNYDNTNTPESVSIITSDDGDDNDKIEILQGNTEIVNASTLDGMDTIVVFDTNQTVNVDGGAPGTIPGDKLVLPDGGVGNDSTPDGVVFLGAGGVINYQDIEQVVRADANESNNTRFEATILGSGMALLERDQSIHTPFDEDWFKVTAKMTGVLQVNAHHFWSENMDLELALFDADGDILLDHNGVPVDIDTQTDNEFAAVPVVGQKTYFVRVRGAREDTEVGSWNFNTYALEIENTPVVTAPETVQMDANSDTGMMNNDNLTADTTPRFVIQADLADLIDPNNDGAADLIVLNPAQAAAMVPGLAVWVTITNAANGAAVTSGFATQLGTSSLFEFTPTALGEGDFAISAAVKVIDGGTPPMMDIGPQSVPLFFTIDTTAPNITTPNMPSYADSGMDSTDNVTNKMAPAFFGNVTAVQPEAGVKVFLLANNFTTGNTDVLFDQTGGIRGTWTFEITSEPLADGEYSMEFLVQDLAGNSVRSEALRMVVDTEAPNTPYLDLLAASDTGRHNADDITLDTTPDFNMTTEDPNVALAVGLGFTDNLKYRVFDRPEGGPEVLIYDSATDAAADAINTAADMFTAATNLIRTLPLAEGAHNLKLEVEDRAGNISHDFLLDVQIDTTAPEKSFGDRDVVNDGLHPDSDSGVAGPGNSVTLVDRVTSDETPTFWGQAEANSIIRAYVNDSGGARVQIGQTVAVPLDGNEDADPNGEGGYWELTSTINMNDPLLGISPIDGLRNAFITAEDTAGNIAAEMALDIFVDTQGPQITEVDITGSPAFNLFDVKPSQGPTPVVNALSISVQDLPNRVVNFLYNALQEGDNDNPVENPGNYSVVGDHGGIVAIDSVVFTPNAVVAGSAATGTIQINFANPLPDDRFTLTISDALVDPAGNALDADSNASQPNGSPALPSGDGQPGGDFVARFTVDTRAELGVWAAGSVYVDTNGNFGFDPENNDGDATNEDITYVLGFTTDNVFAGNFAANAGDTADGFDKLAAYGRVAGAFRWLIDTNNNGVPNLVVADPLAINGLPVAGNFDGNPTPANVLAGIPGNGDEVGLKDSTNWYLDTDHDFNVDTILVGDMIGYPMVGDFDGDGVDDLGAWTDDIFSLDLSLGDGVIDGFTDVQFSFGFPGVRERPVAADFDGDGIDDIGLWAPDRNGAVPEETAEWYIFISDGRPITDRIRNNPQANGGKIVDFTPVPFGNDIYAQFGDDFALPVVGNFDPPVAGENPPQYENATFTNPVNRKDVNGDNIVSPADGLHIINVINAGGAGQLPVFRSEATPTGPFYDTNADGYITPQDVLVVFNQLNEDVLVGEGEGDGALIPETNDVPLPATDRPDELARSVFVTSLRTAPTIERANDRATKMAGDDQQDNVDAFFAQPQALAPSRIDRPSLADDEQLDELLDTLADDLRQQWWDDSSPFEL